MPIYHKSKVKDPLLKEIEITLEVIHTYHAPQICHFYIPAPE